MADIMMCEEADCPLRQTCRRHADSGTRVDPYRQSYWLRDADSPRGHDCPNYWPQVHHG